MPQGPRRSFCFGRFSRYCATESRLLDDRWSIYDCETVFDSPPVFVIQTSKAGLTEFIAKISDIPRDLARDLTKLPEYILNR